MSNAERQRRWRAKHAPPKPPSTDAGILAAENARLKAELAELRKQAKVEVVTGLDDENKRLKAEVAKLRRQAPVEPEIKQLKADNAELQRKLLNARGDINLLRARNHELTDKLKFKEELPQDVAHLQQLLMAARTRNQSLHLENKMAREAARANPAKITKAQRAILRKAVHPDSEHDASPERKQLLTEAAAIFNAIKFHVL